MFEVIKTEGTARRGRFRCAHGGEVQTPVFMNVGTQGAIKGGIDAFDLKELGCQIELSNTYHLHLRPGDDVVRQMGGLHRFMRWDGPTLTDSGGFQVFSLSGLRKIREEGVSFASPLRQSHPASPGGAYYKSVSIPGETSEQNPPIRPILYHLVQFSGILDQKVWAEGIVFLLLPRFCMPGGMPSINQTNSL